MSRALVLPSSSLTQLYSSLSPSLSSISASASLLFHHIQLDQLNEAAKILESDEKLVNSTDSSGSTPLIAAVQQGNILMVGLMLQYSPELAVCRKKESGGLAALHLAAKLDLIDIVKLLVIAKAPLNGRSLSGSTPLIEAAMANALSTVKFLLSIQADASIVDSNGFSAHYYAKKNQYREVAALLPPVYYQVLTQLKKEPKYANQIAGVIETKKKKEKAAARRAAILEKKKQVKQW